MAFVHVGLAKGRTSYWDPTTRTRLDLMDSHKKVFYKEIEELDNLTHGILSSEPSIVAYGKYPTEAIERWKGKFDGLFKTEKPRMIRDMHGNLVPESQNRALDRAEALIKAQEGKEEVEVPEIPEAPEETETPEETEVPKDPEVEEKPEEVEPEGTEEDTDEVEASEVKEEKKETAEKATKSTKAAASKTAKAKK